MQKVLTVACSLLVIPVVAAQDVEEVTIAVEEVARGLYMLIGRGGNIGASAGEDGVFLIDDQYAPLTPLLQEAIAGISPEPVRFVINTHWHSDHTGGNENFGEARALIVAHDNVRQRLSVDQIMEAHGGREVAASPETALPVVTFDRTITFHLNGDTIHAFHVERAHTDGDTIIHFRNANVLHMGDIYFNGTYPFIDWGSGGSINGVIQAVDRALALTDDQTRIIPGHGPPSDRAELLVYREMLATVRDRVQTLIDQGKTLDEIQAATPSAQFDAAWSGDFIGPERWVELVYEGLVREESEK